jgi:GNAT superfamily N-acetyltransferase
VLTVPTANAASLRPWFAPERPGPMIFEHVVRTGNGRCRVDRWPDPRVVLAELPGGNSALRGDPSHGAPADVAGFVEASPEWLPALRAVDPAAAVWNRVIATLPTAAEAPAPRAAVRRLTAPDAAALAGLASDSAWIHDTLGGPSALAAAGVAYGAFVDGSLVSVAVPFYVGVEHEDIGVVTEPVHRRRGLSTACAGALVADIRARGRTPTWTTSPDNAGSLAVAGRLGFVHSRDDVLYAVRTPIPTG